MKWEEKFTVKPNTIEQQGDCKKCGWPVICACCNDGIWGDGTWDWWVYCSNKTCVHHEGDGMFQEEPGWVE